MIAFIQMALLAFLCVLGAYIAVRLLKLKRRIGAIENSLGAIGNSLGAIESSLRLAKSQANKNWSQTEALLAAYRLMDGDSAIPPTRGWAASPDFLRIVLAHMTSYRPSVILECGSGTSTIAMAYAAQTYGGCVYALENDLELAAQLEAEIKLRGLSGAAKVIRCELIERSYPGFDHRFKWYDIDAAQIPNSAEMLVVDGPWRGLNAYARYPAGPELLGRLSPDARIFLDDTNRKDDGDLPRLWHTIFPNLGSRTLKAENGAIELFFISAA